MASARFIAKVSRPAGVLLGHRVPGRLDSLEESARLSALRDCFEKVPRGERQVVFVTGEDEPLRAGFLASPSVRSILGIADAGGAGGHR